MPGKRKMLVTKRWGSIEQKKDGDAHPQSSSVKGAGAAMIATAGAAWLAADAGQTHLVRITAGAGAMPSTTGTSPAHTAGTGATTRHGVGRLQ